MANICPKCSAETDTLEEETREFCIHEKIGIVAIGAVAAVVILFGAGIV